MTGVWEGMGGCVRLGWVEGCGSGEGRGDCGRERRAAGEDGCGGAWCGDGAPPLLPQSYSDAPTPAPP